MNDAFVTAINSQKTTVDYITLLMANSTNLYTPGYKEIRGNFKTCLDGISMDDMDVNMSQGKSVPGLAAENLFIEGKGFFTLKRPDGKLVYSRLGDFKFDAEGNYKSDAGFAVQGYILNDNGEIMSNPVAQKTDAHTATGMDGGPAMMATTDIKLWVDPSNGKYLGKYDEFEVKTNGIMYGKADKGKTVVPLYKVAVMNFPNPTGMTQINDGVYVENTNSGKPIISTAEVRSGLIESSNVGFKLTVNYLQQAKLQLEVINKLIQTNKQLLDEATKLMQ
jgi:flagellar hook protein FlgE